jgi:hypothetical protein
MSALQTLLKENEGGLVVRLEGFSPLLAETETLNFENSFHSRFQTLRLIKRLCHIIDAFLGLSFTFGIYTKV